MFFLYRDKKDGSIDKNYFIKIIECYKKFKISRSDLLGYMEEKESEVK